MKRNKIILTCMVIVSTIVVGVFHLVNERSSMTQINGENDMELTEEQYQLLKDSILFASLEEMSSMRRGNSWLFLNAMREKGFTENRQPGESGVGLATWILELLDVGEIKDLIIDRLEEGIHDLADVLIIRIVNEQNSTYYIWYNRTWGLSMVRKGTEDGEMVYSSATHFIKDGEIHERAESSFVRGGDTL